MRKKSKVILLIVAMLFTLINIAHARTEYEMDFTIHKKTVILQELESEGLNYNNTLSLEEIEAEVQKKTNGDVKYQNALDKIKQLRKADYLYVSDNGDVYSSTRGYLGKANKLERKDEMPIDTHSPIKKKQDNQVTILSQSNPNVNDIHGGNTGAFERRQLNYDGFDGIISNLTLPTISNLGTAEQPWVYYGFDPSSGTGVEGGYAYQTGNPRWLPYIRTTSGFVYADEAYKKYDGNTINNVKFYVKKAASTDTYFTAYLIIGATQVKIASTNFTSISSLSVKRVTSIAKAGFDGTNIAGKSLNQKWDSVQVSKYNSDYYTTWGSNTEYSYWNTINQKWYGTIDCLTSYIKRSSGYISIYK
jgi:hypothetical protein